MRSFRLLITLAALGGGAYWARPDLYSFLRLHTTSERCKPIPVSGLDPQPGLAPFRCAPEVPGPGPDSNPDPERQGQGQGGGPAEPGRAAGPGPNATLRQLVDERDRAYEVFREAQRAGYGDRGARYEAYQRAETRLARARNAAIERDRNATATAR